MRPSSGHLTASGAIELVAGGSHVAHRGKTVTARLAVRLSRSLAGATLRVAVQTTDRHGHRQVEASAGRIRVTQ